MSELLIKINILDSRVDAVECHVKTTLENLGETVKRLRGFKSLSQRAAQIGISKATLSRIENGKMPDLITFAKISKFYKLDIRSILNC